MSDGPESAGHERAVTHPAAAVKDDRARGAVKDEPHTAPDLSGDAVSAQPCKAAAGAEHPVTQEPGGGPCDFRRVTTPHPAAGQPQAVNAAGAGPSWTHNDQQKALALLIIHLGTETEARAALGRIETIADPSSVTLEAWVREAAPRKAIRPLLALQACNPSRATSGVQQPWREHMAARTREPGPHLAPAVPECVTPQVRAGSVTGAEPIAGA